MKRQVVLVAVVCLAVGVMLGYWLRGGGTVAGGVAANEEAAVRAKYAEYLDMKEKYHKLCEEASKEYYDNLDKKKKEVRELEMKSLRSSSFVERDIEHEGHPVKKAKDELEKMRQQEPPPHPNDAEIKRLYKSLGAMRDEYESRWKSLNIKIEGRLE